MRFHVLSFVVAALLCCSLLSSVLANDVKPSLDSLVCGSVASRVNTKCWTKSNTARYCRQSDALLGLPTCSDTTTLSGFDTTLEERHQCEKGYFRYRQKCTRLAAPGCRFETSDGDKFLCAGSTHRDGECKTDDDDDDDDDGRITTIGRRCRTTGDQSDRCSEKANLFCNEYQICEKRPSMGDRCSATANKARESCVWPSVCSNGYCKPFHFENDYTFENGGSEVCQSGDQINGICRPTYYSKMPLKCFTNADCGDYGVCDRDEENQDYSGRGLCVSWSHVAEINLGRCYSANCVDVDEKQCKHDHLRCMSAYVMHECAKQCGKRPDYRFDVRLPYVFDCDALTFVNMTGEGSDDGERMCEVEEQFLNCDAVHDWYPISAAQSAHSNIMTLILSAAAIALVVL